MSVQETFNLPVITGLTASGKSSLALALIERLAKKGIRVEIICCDSMLVYRKLDIGTDKPSAAVQAQIPHHCLNLVAPDEPFSVGDYIREAHQRIVDVRKREALPLLVGGTGLYLRGLTQGLLQLPDLSLKQKEMNDFRRGFEKRAAEEGDCKSIYAQLQKLDPEAARKIHCNDLYRMIRALEIFEFTGKPLSAYQKEHAFAEKPYQTRLLAIERPREQLYERINARLEEMLNNGLEKEITELLGMGYSPELRPLKALAYRYFIAAHQKKISREEALAKTQQESRRFAKRQATWFRALPEIRWLDCNQDEKDLIDASAAYLFACS